MSVSDLFTFLFFINFIIERVEVSFYKRYVDKKKKNF